MMTARGPMVLEFNCRFGDPETQPILMRLESDLLDTLEAAVEGRFANHELRWLPDAAVCVVIASGGYPGTFEAGKKLAGLEQAGALEGVKVFTRRPAIATTSTSLPVGEFWGSRLARPIWRAR